MGQTQSGAKKDPRLELSETHQALATDTLHALCTWGVASIQNPLPLLEGWWLKKHSDKSRVKRVEAYSGSQFQGASTMVRRPWQQELEAAAHLVLNLLSGSREE